MKKILLIFLSLLSFYSFGATVIVTNTNDTGSGSLRAAIVSANAGDTIRFSANLIAGGSDTINFNTQINIDSGIHIIGLYNYRDTLFFNGRGLNRVFEYNLSLSSNKNIIFDSIVVINCQTSSDGAAIKGVDADSVFIRNAFIRNSVASGNGGAVSILTYQKSCIVIIENSVFKNNISNGGGGAIYSSSSSIISSTETIVLSNGSTFENNFSGVLGGGAIYVNDFYLMSKAIIKNSTFKNNSGTGMGGAIMCKTQSRYTLLESEHNSVVEVSNSFFENNTVGQYKSGGAIYCANQRKDTIKINTSTFTGNQAGGDGGAVFSGARRSFIFIDRSTFNDNKAFSGGAIGISANDIAITRINNSTFTKNEAKLYGGVLRNSFGDTAVVEVNNSTLVYNDSTRFGGAIFCVSNSSKYAEVFLKGSILAFNGNASIYNNYNSSFTSLGHNIIDTFPVTGNISTDIIAASDTLVGLGAIQLNGGNNKTLIPSSTSIALNVGDSSDFTDAQNRPIIGFRDIGSAEYNCQIISTDTVTICPRNYMWRGKNYSTPKLYRDVVIQSSGCDSVYQLSLNFLPNTDSTITITSCDSFLSPSGKILTSSGINFDTIPNHLGCDSVITINLTIIKTTTSNISIAVCDSFNSPSGKTWNISGIYLDTILNSLGCDSIMTINLTVNTIDTTTTIRGNTIFSNEAAAKYQWFDCSLGYSALVNDTNQFFVASYTGNYAVEIIKNGCTDTSSCVYLSRNCFAKFVPTQTIAGQVILLDSTIGSHLKYKWYFGDGDSSSAYLPTHTYDSAGTYYVCLSIVDTVTYCSDIFCDSITVDTSGLLRNSWVLSVIRTIVSLKEINNLENIVFYPNPSNGTFTLDLGKQTVLNRIFITDINGRLIKEITPQNVAQYEINFEGSSGVYLLNIIGENERKTLKIIKE